MDRKRTRSIPDIFEDGPNGEQYLIRRKFIKQKVIDGLPIKVKPKSKKRETMKSLPLKIRVIFFFSVIFSLSIIFNVSALADDVEPETISIPEEHTIKRGEQWSIPITLTPDEATPRFSTYSSNPEIVDTSTTGGYTGVRVFGASPGTATVTVKTFNGLEASCSIVVEDAPEPQSISIPEKLSVYVGEKCYIPITLLPEDCQTRYYISSTDYSVISVGTAGSHISCFVKGQTCGTAEITVSTENGISAKCVITVYQDPDDEIEKNTITLPSNLSTISAEAFSTIAAKKIVIPASVSTIEAAAFADCPNLSILYFEGNPETIDLEIVNSSVSVSCLPGGSVEKWATSKGLSIEYH